MKFTLDEDSNGLFAMFSGSVGKFCVSNAEFADVLCCASLNGVLVARTGHPVAAVPQSSRLDGFRSGTRRIRLVAYGARLESALSASSHGFESHILRV